MNSSISHLWYHLPSNLCFGVIMAYYFGHLQFVNNENKLMRIKNGHFRETGNSVYTRHRTKIDKANKNATQKTKTCISEEKHFFSQKTAQ